MLKCSGTLKFFVFFLNGDIMIWSFCGTMGATSLRCILSDPGNNKVVKTRVLPQPTDQGQCSDYKITHPQQVSAHRCWDASAHLIVWVFVLPKGKKNLPKNQGFSNSELQATTHLASLGDEWEHLQKYFTMSLFCERATRGKNRNF